MNELREKQGTSTSNTIPKLHRNKIRKDKRIHVSNTQSTVWQNNTQFMLTVKGNASCQSCNNWKCIGTAPKLL